MRLRAIVVAALAACLSATRALAQTAECDDSSVQGVAPLEVIPSDGAAGVARDVALIVRYGKDADLDGLLQTLADAPGTDACARALVCLFRETGDAGAAAREVAKGRIERLDEHSVAFIPDAALAASSSYLAAIARPGFDNASRTDVEFETGPDFDREAPRFDPGTGQIDLEVDTPPEECAAPAGSLRVRLGMPRALDDGDEESVRILLYLTRAAGLAAPLLRARAKNPDSGRVQMRFLLTPKQARSPLCVALRAVDGAGKLARGEPQLCFDPARGSHFSGCGVARAAVRGGRGTMAAGACCLVPLCAVLAAARRRRWLRQRRRIA